MSAEEDAFRQHVRELQARGGKQVAHCEVYGEVALYELLQPHLACWTCAKHASNGGTCDPLQSLESPRASRL
jgi:hypothetical protein